MKDKIVVTGMGTVAAVGNTVKDVWESVRNSKNGVSFLNESERYNDLMELLPVESREQQQTVYAATVKNFDPNEILSKKEVRKMDRFCHFALAAAGEAIVDSQIDCTQIDPFKMGCVMGVGIGGIESYMQQLTYMQRKGKTHPMTISYMISNSASANIAMQHGLKGPNYAVSTACSSSADAIGAAMRHLRLGEADVMITGGSEGGIVPFSMYAFNAVHALSTKWKEEPHRASRPFDKNRDGFVMGEGAGVLVLERLEHAKKRGAKIYAEIVSYGTGNDAYHYTAPHPEGLGIVHAMKHVLTDAGIAPETVSYINAHGTSTVLNDRLETAVIKKVFGKHAYSLKISSTKSMIGHCLGASGAIEAIVTIKAINDQFAPPTINLENNDEQCDLDYVPKKGIAHEIEYAISNSLGFGGHNSVLLFRRYHS